MYALRKAPPECDTPLSDALTIYCALLRLPSYCYKSSFIAQDMPEEALAKIIQDCVIQCAVAFQSKLHSSLVSGTSKFRFMA